MTIYLVCAINIIYIYLRGPGIGPLQFIFFPHFYISTFDDIGTIDMISIQKTFEHLETPTYAQALLDEVMLVEVSMRVLSGGTATIILILMIDLFD